ncbi:hypothetical protein [Acinetobacter sp. YH12063]|uniref:hypothetical protein n=1 Tax=Acinetobacter sp. YH12063 TaxID=2601061 RepID=UPI0015D35A6F|nr:hypothetical protein [Acinetobacter sp. YH12063]
MDVKYKLSIAILSIYLTACGGGGGDSSVKEEPKPEPVVVSQSYYSFNFDFENYRSFSYFNNEPTRSYMTDVGWGEYLLTQQSLYTDMKVKGDTRAINELTLYFSDAPNVARTEYLKKTDLSGISIFDGVYLGFQGFFKAMNGTPIYANEKIASLYVNAGVEQTFPPGSVCYHLEKSVPTKPYIWFTHSGFKDIAYSYMPQLIESWKKDAKSYGYTTRVTSGKWNAYPWTKVQILDKYGVVNSIVVVNYQGMIFEAEMVDGEVFEQSKDAAAYLKRAQQFDPASEAYQHRLAISTYIGNNCKYYNDIAIAAIQRYNAIS